ncbi:MAG: hypothetical protein KGL39_13940 [Patescibacteria group bacterium]|nr:hypothetical protein [Patescibacteria group bacterium]
MNRTKITAGSKKIGDEIEGQKITGFGRVWLERNGRKLQYAYCDNAQKTASSYPTSGTITEDDPSIYGSAVLGHEGESWVSFNRRHELRIQGGVYAPYSRGVGHGFGATEEGDL